MNLEQLEEKRAKLEEAIAFNVSCPEMLPYQKAKLATVERAIAAFKKVGA